MKHFTLPHRSVISAVKTSTTAASIGLIGGIALQSVTQQLVFIVPMLIALPAINAMAGDYATIITAHIGDPEMSKLHLKKLIKALISSVPISVVGVVGLSLFFAVLQGYSVTRSFMYTYTLFVFFAFSLVVTFTVVSSVLLNKVLISKQVNSDDILIPVSNVLASVLMLILVALAAWQLF